MPCFANQSALLLHSRTKRFTTPGYFQLGGKPYSMSGIKQHDPSTLVRLSGFAGYKHIYINIKLNWFGLMTQVTNSTKSVVRVVCQCFIVVCQLRFNLKPYLGSPYHTIHDLTIPIHFTYRISTWIWEYIKSRTFCSTFWSKLLTARMIVPKDKRFSAVFRRILRNSMPTI